MQAMTAKCNALNDFVLVGWHRRHRAANDTALVITSANTIGSIATLEY